MTGAQPHLKLSSLQASLWDTGSKNSQWKKKKKNVGLEGCVWECYVDAHAHYVCKYESVVSMWANVSAHLAVLSKNCQLQAVKEDRGRRCYRRFEPSSQHFHFVCCKLSVKLWWRAICISGWLWRGWLCSLPPKSRARTLLAPKHCPPHHQPAPTLCPSPSALLAALFCCFGQRLFHHCVVWPRAPAGRPFIKPPGVFQEDPRAAPQPQHTHQKSDR